MRIKIVLLSLFSIALFHITHIEPANAQSPKLAAKADSLFQEWNKPGRPGAAVGVVHQGKLVYAKGFGEADVETGAPITPATIFHMASVSKQFTAYAIAMLAQQGKLSLDDDIRKYIPEVPDFGKTITIRHLVNHTSGLRDQWNLLAMAGWQLDDVITKEHVLNLVKRQKELNFEPGSAFTYCNTGYTLLAETVARVTKQSFPDWMQANVFKPLGMKNTLFYDDGERIVKGRAYSFHKSAEPGNGYSKSILSYSNVGATSLFTTVNDLTYWIDNFRVPKVGNAAINKQMQERGRLNKGDTLPYSFGLMPGKYKGLNYFWHNGGDAGFRTHLSYFPDEDYGFIVLSNEAEFSPDKKAFELINVFLASRFREEKPAAPVKPAPVADYQIDSTIFNQYVGAYELSEAPGFILNFTKSDSKYYLQATGQNKFEIFPSSDTTFFLKVVEASVVFHKPKEGKVNKITLRQNGNHPGNRIERPKVEEVKKGQFVGKYYSPELETFYSITLTSDTLRMVHVHHGEVVLNVVNNDRLQAPWWFVQNVDFARDAAGTITGLRMTNGRVVNLWFKRLPDDFESNALPAKGK